MVLELFSTCGGLAESTISNFTNGNGNVNGNVNANGNANGYSNVNANGNANGNGNVNVLDVKNMDGSDVIALIIVLVICTLPAVVIATRCNPKCPVLMGIVAFLFDRIYLFQHVVRKYLLREKNYCKNISCK